MVTPTLLFHTYLRQHVEEHRQLHRYVILLDFESAILTSVVYLVSDNYPSHVAISGSHSANDVYSLAAKPFGAGRVPNHHDGCSCC